VSSIELVEFIVESNQIEGITELPTDREIAAHERLLALAQIRVRDLEQFVADVAGAQLRRQSNRRITVGGNPTPPGGPEIESTLRWLLERAHTIDSPHTTHVQYELLHPFRDGNGRSGRALWAWQMQQAGLDPFIRPFLQSFYYQTLDAARV
jgi:Fic family protein